MISGAKLNAIVSSAVDENVSLAFLLTADGVVISLAEAKHNIYSADNNSCKSPHEQQEISATESEVDDATTITPKNCNNRSEDVEKANDERARLITAVTNMLRAYRSCYLAKNRLTNDVEESALEMMLVNWDNRRLCVMTTAMQTAICLVTNHAYCEIGLLKLKTAALQRSINALFSNISTVTNYDTNIVTETLTY